MKLRIFVFALLASSVSIFGQNAPQNWYHLDASDGFQGVSSQKAYKELIKDKQGKTVIVAVIDSGIDIEHEDLKDNIWINSREIPGNGIDDDQNGYIDDIHGWNFIGGPGGKNVGPETYEATRVYASLKYKYDNAVPEKLNKKQKEEYELYTKVKQEVENSKSKAESSLARINGIEEQINMGLDKIEKALAEKGWSLDSISKLDFSNDASVTIATKVIDQIGQGDSEAPKDVATVRKEIGEALAEDKERFENQINYAYNTDYDSRKLIVKDNYNDSSERIYGNNDVEGPDALHGTHVAGIIGAMADNGLGNDGIARNVKLMSVRAVPDGDERDKDVANAIRYAVDNGASIINMSFGKGYSWDKKAVNDAVEYAAKHDVLLVHAAGNSAQDNDSTDNFPNDNLGKKGFLCKKVKTAPNWIEVGALSYKPKEDMVATFSNYGQKNVDIFSPGVQIYNTLPNNQYANLQGTSMASPVVAGVAAVLRSQYPALTAEQVKDILLKSASTQDALVHKPGDKNGDKVSFKSLSVTGGTVNLYNALKMAAGVKGKKKLPAAGNA